MSKWDKAHMSAAQKYATLSNALKLQVGCLLVKDNRVISIGVNGTPSGWDNTCEDKVYHELGQPKPLSDSLVEKAYPLKEQTACKRTWRRFRYETRPEVLHAEANAIAKVSKSTESSAGSTAYITHEPCMSCAKLLYQAGINRVVYGSPYEKVGGEGIDFLVKCGIEVKYEPL